jgi:hypothetical protein
VLRLPTNDRVSAPLHRGVVRAGLHVVRAPIVSTRGLDVSSDEELSADERDENVALDLTALIGGYLRERKLRGSIEWDGLELLVRWTASEEGEF